MNRLCDRFEASFSDAQERENNNSTIGGAAGAEDSHQPDIRKFIADDEELKSLDAVTETFISDLRTELLVIEFQKKESDDARELIEKYPELTAELSAARLLQNARLRGSQPSGTDPASISTANQSLLLPIEESLGRSGISDPASTNGQPAGQQFGRYQIIKRLGAGGFGVVFQAFDTVMKRDVAIKIPRMSLLDDSSAQMLLDQELSAISRLNHPKIVTAYNAEEIEGYFCLVSEFVDGLNLETWLGQRKSALPPNEAAELALQIVEAIEEAHRNDIVHRDVKPSNILVIDSEDDDPQIKLTDFGLAKVLKDQAASTSTGMNVGTLQYMSPEQLRLRESAGYSSDIYSVGVIFYQLLTKEYPFDSDSEIELIAQILERQPNVLSNKKHRVPADLAAIVSRCLMKRPRDRYASAAELKMDLESFLSGTPVVAKPLGWIGKLNHWSLSKSRMRDAGVYSLILNIILSVWSLGMPLLGGPFGIHEFVGLQRPVEAMGTAALLLFVFEIPLGWAALKTIQFKRIGIAIGFPLAFINLCFIVAILIGALPPNFGGIYNVSETRGVSFTLLTILSFLQVLLYSIAWRAWAGRRSQ